MTKPREPPDDDAPGPPPRSFGYSLEWLSASPDARKETRRRRQLERIAETAAGNEATVDDDREKPRSTGPDSADSPPAPAIDFDALAGDRTPDYLAPGARKERLKRRDYRKPPRGPSRGSPSRRSPSLRSPSRRHRPPRYVELHAASAFSFLDGASPPEDLVERAAELGLPAVGLVDRNGVYGAPRFYQAAKEAGLRALVGAEMVVSRGVGGAPGATAADAATDLGPEPSRLTLLVESRLGYRNLAKLLTAAARDRPKGEAEAGWRCFEEHAEGLWCLTGGAEGPLARTLEDHGLDAARRLLDRLKGVFGDRVRVEIQRHRLRREEFRNRALVDLARSSGLPVVATNGARYARTTDKPLHDLLTCLRHKTHLDAAGRLVEAHRERHLKGAREMAELFADHPRALEESAALARRLDFTLADLGYRFPDYPLPPGETAGSYLRQVTWNVARARFRPLSARAQEQLARELDMIDKLDLAGYFLIVWDLIRFCKREGILAQGRGSAANSAVCYALSITAVDPVKMGLLFERFLSEERGEWPDIDLDLPSGDQREKVIQYVYRRYGPHGAAMTANVITYRDRSAARETAKALGFSEEQQGRLSKRLGSWHYDTSRGDEKTLATEIAAAGLDPADPRVGLFADLWRRIHNLPRHLGQHSGGMVIAAGRLDEVVPLEPAAMEGRVVVQWDKDDCADLGIIKVDLLGLGMLQALEEAIPLIRTHERREVDLAHLPADDPPTYEMLRQADTVGVFQVESRAQMASLPRNNPERFYDLVIQVAIIRPGPIVGGMVHPYFERRNGRQPVEYPHPCLEPILERTLGVPLFQEQILRIAMEAAGFSGGEAEELRRAMGFKRSVERMDSIEERLRRGMRERGITGETQDAIVHSITSFALYGFPESHAASFALIAYASAYLKRHHPTAFYVSLLNAWPMGFYHPATLVQDAERHGVRVRPIDVHRSGWRCRWEKRGTEARASPGRESAHTDAANARAGSRRVPRRVPRRVTRADIAPGWGPASGAVRIGLRFVRGLGGEAGARIEAEAARRPFTDVEDLARRARLRESELTTLAEAGALASLGLTRRQALWQVARAARPAGPLLADAGEENTAVEAPVYGSSAGAADAAGRGETEAGADGRGVERSGTDPSQPRPGDTSPLPEMTAFEETLADYATTGLTAGPHPLTQLRPVLDRYGVVRAADLSRLPNGRRARIAGTVIVRQRPGTAKGILFVTLEDESGMAQAIVHPDLLAAERETIVGASGLVVEGILQKRDGSLSLKAERFCRLTELAPAPLEEDSMAVPSHDWR